MAFPHFMSAQRDDALPQLKFTEKAMFDRDD
jgi:hypothetical protein